MVEQLVKVGSGEGLFGGDGLLAKVGKIQKKRQIKKKQKNKKTSETNTSKHLAGLSIAQPHTATSLLLVPVVVQGKVINEGDVRHRKHLYINAGNSVETVRG